MDPETGNDVMKPERGRAREAFQAGRGLAALALALALPAAAPAASPIWAVEGVEGTVRIAGTLHYLREEDHPLPGPLLRAFEQADALVVEYDMRPRGMPVRVRSLTRQVPRAGRIQPLGPLRRSLSTPEFTELRRLARKRDFDIDFLDSLEPWFAGMYVVERQLSLGGFEPEFGVDNYLINRAHEQGKPVISLDTAQEQRALFLETPREDQIEFLVSALEDAPRMPQAMASLAEKWRDGDLGWLERSLLWTMKGRPTEYERFALERNRRWAERLDARLGDGRNYLVLVGTVHLLGEDSLIDLLSRRGYRLARWP